MADEVNENIFLVNAPAGSGKTTWIRQQVESYLLRNPKDNILCITYTNRAAEELGRDLEQSRVYFGTIHSFINDFIGSFFSHKEIIDLYWEVYETQIIERIKNTEQKETWTEGAERYKEKYGSLDLDTVRSNINKISYNETPFNSLLYGGLGHNDLITFTKLAVDRFPIIKKKISDKYQLIFIDEYQDTSAEVLHIFYTSLVGKKSKLYLLGDKMQQIYKNYNGEFEEKLETFNRSVNLSINYRTTPKIVDILNYIYNDEALKQCPYEKNSNDTMAFSPKVLIVSDVEKAISDFRKTYEDALLLYVSNRARFYDIGAGNLYDAYNKMEKYQFWKKYSAVDVMTKDEARINDALLSFLFIVDQIIEYYLQECYGEVFRNIHEYYMYFNSEKYIVEKHRDKKTIKTRLEKIKNSYVDRATTIDGFLNICFKEEFIEEEIYCSIIEDDDYQLVKDVYIEEVRKLTNYLNDPRVSTQHGVKGESHDTVVFVADNSSNPAVHMSKFFEVWSEMNITLREFDALASWNSEIITSVLSLASDLIDNNHADRAEALLYNWFYDVTLEQIYDCVKVNDGNDDGWLSPEYRNIGNLIGKTACATQSTFLLKNLSELCEKSRSFTGAVCDSAMRSAFKYLVGNDLYSTLADIELILLDTLVEEIKLLLSSNRINDLRQTEIIFREKLQKKPAGLLISLFVQIITDNICFSVEQHKSFLEQIDTIELPNTMVENLMSYYSMLAVVSAYLSESALSSEVANEIAERYLADHTHYKRNYFILYFNVLCYGAKWFYQKENGKTSIVDLSGLKVMLENLFLKDWNIQDRDFETPRLLPYILRAVIVLATNENDDKIKEVVFDICERIFADNPVNSFFETGIFFYRNNPKRIQEWYDDWF